MAFIPAGKSPLPLNQIITRAFGVLLYSLAFFVMGMYWGGQDQAKRDQAELDKAQVTIADLQGSGAEASVPVYTPIDKRDLTAAAGRIFGSGEPPSTRAIFSLDKDKDAALTTSDLEGEGVRAVVYKISGGSVGPVFSLTEPGLLVASSDSAKRQFTLSWGGTSHTYVWAVNGFVETSEQR